MSTSAHDGRSPERAAPIPHQETWFRTLVENSSDAIALLDDKGTFLYVSPSVLPIAGYTPAELVGRNGFDFIPAESLTLALEQFTDVVQTLRKTITVEHQFLHKSGAIIWIESTVTNLLHDAVIGALVSNFRNITTRKQIEQRQHTLDEVGSLLASSLEQHITLNEIVHLLVPSLADYCRIVILDKNRQIKEISAHHFDSQKIALVQALYEQYKDRTNSTHGVQRLLEHGRAELISVVTEDVLETIKDNSDLLAIVHTLGLQSYMGVPLIARGNIIGVITFSSIQPHRHYTVEDVVFAEELARRIALMLDNARLYQEAQTEIEERKLVEAQLRESEERKNAFINMASHELKTPVTSLKGFTNILQRRLHKQEDQQSLMYLTKIDRQVNKLTKLINDLLDVSKMQTGKLTYQEEYVDLLALVHEIVENIQGTTQTHTLRVEWTENAENAGNAEPVMVFGDRDRLGQVLINLLTNAIKYSPQADRVVIKVERMENEACISVQDFGIGISEKYKDKIFEQFYQIDDPEEKTYPGLGLGLYISSEIVKRHRGRLWVESSKGQGSIFHLMLPIANQ